jgi:hypothetical protein
MVIGAPKVDQHVALRFIVTNTLYEADARCVDAVEWGKIDGPAIFDVDGFRFYGPNNEDGDNSYD